MTAPQGEAGLAGGWRGRLLVTGANGHLGRRLARRLAGSDAVSLRAFVRSERARATVDALPAPARPETVVADYRDAAALERAARGCRAIVHLVGTIKESRTTRYADAHEGTCQTVGRAAAKAGVERVVYLSIFGADPASRNACLASKGRAEQILLHSDVSATVLRLPMVLGPGDVASRALRGQARAGVLPLVRGGASLEQPIDADDVLAGLLSAVSRAELDDVALDLGGPESLTHRDLVLRAAALYGRAPRIVPVPRWLVRGFAALVERAADPPLTRAMLGVLEHDDRVDPGPACQRLGLSLTPLDTTLRRCVGPGSERNEEDA